MRVLASPTTREGTGVSGLLLHGPPGNGKRTLAAGIAQKLRARHFVLDVGDVVSHSASGGGGGVDSAGAAVRSTCQVCARLCFAHE
jgi:predicted kinase